MLSDFRFMLTVRQLDKTASKGRSDDCGSLRDNGLKYIPHIPGIHQLEPNAKKEQRGFRHHSTARLLCPRRLRDRFDEDRDKFCINVQNGTQPITHKSWPSFLYPEDGYDPNEIDKNLLRGPFLLAVSRHNLQNFSNLKFVCSVSDIYSRARAQL